MVAGNERRLIVTPDVQARAMTQWTREQSELLSSWRAHAAAAQHAHYLLVGRFRLANLWLGIPAVITSAIVGTSLFATLADEKGETLPPEMRVAIGSLSVVAAVLAATQTFLGFAKRSEQHVQAADWYAAIRRKIDELLAFRPEDRGDPKKILDELRSDMNRASETYPEIGEVTWHAVARRYGVQQPPFPEEDARRVGITQQAGDRSTTP